MESLETAKRDLSLPDAPGTGAFGGVILRFAGARYAVDMSTVAEVVPVPVLTRVPGGPPWLSGVVNWRGRVLPVLDLRPLVGAPLSPMPTSARLVVLTEDDVEVGVIADMVPGLLDCDPELLEALPATVSKGIAPLVRGVVNFDGPVALLDTHAVLAMRSQLASARRG
ncbi:MAG: chemotaxis protein CheW [Candidatus Nanopelagicales bacterium]